jgi:hypothetical protein
MARGFSFQAFLSVETMSICGSKQHHSQSKPACKGTAMALLHASSSPADAS